MIKISMPANASRIIHKLQNAGYEAYIVGGCVRDAILGKEPDDWDITTSATPWEVKKLFSHTIDTGIQHGTVTVMMKNRENGNLEGYEVTTYRVDGKYEDHRRPKEVTFTASLIEDMKRRDFTINAMAYNETEGVIDHFGGMEDLDRHIIRCVGKPSERFDEDALRILRAVRFAAQLDFTIEETTRQAIEAQACYLRDISAERIRVELNKLLLSNHPEQLRTAYQLGVTKVVLPEFDVMMQTEQNHKHHMYSVGEHTIKVIEEVPATQTLRWAALLHDVGKPLVKTCDEQGEHFYGHNKEGERLAGEILRRLKFDNDTIARVKRLVLWHDYGMGQLPSLKSFRKSLSKMGADLFPEYVEIKRADILAQSDYMRKEKLDNLKSLQQYYEQIIEEQQCLSLKDLAVKGKDLMELGMKPGKDLGVMLSYLLEQVLEEPQRNTKDMLLQLAKEKMME
jgi:tRNA nucleotidyltransferase (CCA-adding enzyme)